MRKMVLLAAVLTLLMLPGRAHADWLLTPNVGATFGGDATDNSQFTYGLTFGWMGAGVLGWEADLAFTPDFFDTTPYSVDFTGTNNVVSWMANVVAGVPLGGQRGPGFRPFVTAGVGALQRRVGESSDLFRVRANEFGFNVGAGAMSFFNDHVGLRGEVRYYRSFEDPTADGGFALTSGDFDFWRGTGGLTFRW